MNSCAEVFPPYPPVSEPGRALADSSLFSRCANLTTTTSLQLPADQMLATGWSAAADGLPAVSTCCCLALIFTVSAAWICSHSQLGGFPLGGRLMNHPDKQAGQSCTWTAWWPDRQSVRCRRVRHPVCLLCQKFNICEKR